jgi:hypothetical protein
MNAAARLAGAVWRWSWLATLPIVVAFGYWLAVTWRQFVQFGVRVDAAPYAVTLRSSGSLQFEQIVRRLRLAATGASPNDDADAARLRSVELFLAREQRALLDRDLPYSGQEAQRGRFACGGRELEVSIRYRGDTIVHWGYAKKSFRVRTRRDEAFEGMQTFNLIAAKTPEHLNNHLSYSLARRLGLIAPRSELVKLFLDGAYHGLYELTEQLDEGTLRRHGRVAGDLFAGELIALDAVEGTTNRVFELPRLWSQVVAGQPGDPGSPAPIERLHALLQGNPDAAGVEALARFVDVDAFARLSAFELLTQTHHDDHVHNWRLHWDPWRARLEPVVWDPVGWHATMRPQDGGAVDLDAIYSQLHEWLHMDAEFVAARHRHLCGFLASPAADAFLAECDADLRSAFAALRSDPNVLPPDLDVVRREMAALATFVRAVFAELRTSCAGAGELRWARGAEPGAIDLECATRAPLDGVAILGDRPLRPGRVLLQVRRADRVETTDLGACVVLGPDSVFVPLRLASELSREFRLRGPGLGIRNQRRHVEPTCVRLVLEGVDTRHIVDVRGRRAGDEVRFERAERLEPRTVDLLFRIASDVPPPLQTLSGDQHVDGLREIDGPVLVRPGTTFRLGPGASLVFRGRVLALGTAEAPIQFVAADPQAPWGAVALAGSACSGSRLQHCDLRGGSAHPGRLARFDAMLAIHDCDDVVVRDCRVADGGGSFAMVHTVRAEATFERCELRDAAAAALRADRSRLVLRDSIVAGCGANGADLAATQAVLADCRFADCRLAGVSIADDARLVAVRSRFERCGVALAARDGALGQAANCEFRACGRAADASRFDGRRDAGGTLVVQKSALDSGTGLPTADRWSHAELFDCDAAGTPAADYEQARPDGSRTRAANTARLIACSQGDAALDAAPIALAPDLRAGAPAAARTWASVKPSVRGIGGGQ